MLVKIHTAGKTPGDQGRKRRRPQTKSSLTHKFLDHCVCPRQKEECDLFAKNFGLDNKRVPDEIIRARSLSDKTCFSTQFL